MSNAVYCCRRAFDLPELHIMRDMLAARTRVAQEGVCWRGRTAATPAHTPLQQGAALRVEREQRGHQKALTAAENRVCKEEKSGKYLMPAFFAWEDNDKKEYKPTQCVWFCVIICHSTRVS